MEIKCPNCYEHMLIKEYHEEGIVCYCEYCDEEFWIDKENITGSEDKYIIKMLDGGIKDIATDSWTECQGCPTCGYGGWICKKMVIEMKNINLKIEMGDMYDFSLPSYEDLIKWFVKHTEKIKTMTELEFVNYIKENNNFRCDETKFFLLKEI